MASDIHDRLQTLRRDQGLSLRAFVKLLRSRAAYTTSHDSIRRYESGEARMPADFVAAVCNVFDVSADEFLLGRSRPTDRRMHLLDSALEEIAAVVARSRRLQSDSPDGGSLKTIRSEWTRFTRGLPPRHQLRSAIIESWQRSRDAGVAPTREVPSPSRVTERELARRTRLARSLIEAARPHLTWLSAVAGDTPHVVYLVCSDGIILVSHSNDSGLVREWGLEPGYDWSEQSMGTNGAGTAVATGKVVAVIGPEHFAQQFHGAACLAAPIRNHLGGIEGAIDLSTSVDECLPERLALVAYIAERIECDLERRLRVVDNPKGN